MAGLPPLQLSSGPAMAEGDATAGGGTTGDFIFRGSSMKGNGQSWVSTIGPVAIVGLAIWLIYRK